MKTMIIWNMLLIIWHGNYHVIVVTECWGVRTAFHDINAIYSVENIRVSSVIKLTEPCDAVEDPTIITMWCYMNW